MAVPSRAVTTETGGSKGSMKDTEGFIKAYREFRDAVDLRGNEVLPDINTVSWCMLMGIPDVPADNDPSPEGSAAAIDQRVAILKAVFVEANRSRNDAFLDEGLSRYDRAGDAAKRLLQEEF
jgi:hypothetical protein